jgi:low temperature requirement protein LtrA
VFARFTGLLVVVIWAWVLYTLYTNRFDTDDVIFRTAKSVAMLAIAAVAVNVPHAMAGHGGTVGFAVGYVVVRAVLIALYGRARYHLRGDGRRLAGVYLVGYGSTTVGLVFVYAHFSLLAGVAAFGEGTKIAIMDAVRTSVSAGARWAMAGGVAAFALSLAAIHLGAEWTSPRDRTFLSRIVLALVGVVLAAAGGGVAPAWFAGLLAAAVLGQLLFEAATPRSGARTPWVPAADTSAVTGGVADLAANVCG